MNKELFDELKSLLLGEVTTDKGTLKEFSHDTSLFEVVPQAVVFPKDTEDLERLVKFVTDKKRDYPELSLTGRSAGTDMSGGSINDSIIVEFGKYFNNVSEVESNSAWTEPGVFYRDFEKETLKKKLLFPSYPASREICAMGGIVNNNAGGEKSLEYGKTENYVKRIKVVLSDGNEYEIKPLNKKQLETKISQKDFEGEIYRKVFEIIEKNYEVIKKAKPKVLKNSAGYALWNVWDRETGIFDLTKLWVGSQGTLGLMTGAEIGLVPTQKHHQMMVIFLPDMKNLGEITNLVLDLKPESFESYDDNTLKLALRYFPEFAKKLGLSGMIQAGLAFLPAFLMMFTGRLPKLILQVDFTGDDEREINQKILKLKESLAPFHLTTQVAVEEEETKYWMIRRESFNLLRSKIRNKHTAPFIDDFVIDPQKVELVIPQITGVLKKHPEFIFTVAGHMGEGNFHIIPIVDIKDPIVREAIPKIAEEVYRIVIENGGSITGEHNDGLIRTPYLTQMFGEEMVTIFQEIKEVFDPLYIFNPRKKVKGDLKYAMEHLREEW